MFCDFECNKVCYIVEDFDIYFEDIIDVFECVWDMFENYKEVVEGLEVINELVFVYWMNEIFWVLMVISFIFLFLMLIVSVWGMNVKVFGEGLLYVFFVIMVVMFVVLIGVVLFFCCCGWL